MGQLVPRQVALLLQLVLLPPFLQPGLEVQRRGGPVDLGHGPGAGGGQPHPGVVVRYGE